MNNVFLLIINNINLKSVGVVVFIVSGAIYMIFYIGDRLFMCLSGLIRFISK